MTSREAGPPARTTRVACVITVIQRTRAKTRLLRITTANYTPDSTHADDYACRIPHEEKLNEK